LNHFIFSLPTSAEIAEERERVPEEIYRFFLIGFFFFSTWVNFLMCLMNFFKMRFSLIRTIREFFKFTFIFPSSLFAISSSSCWHTKQQQKEKEKEKDVT
jgi:hypothetical protein